MVPERSISHQHTEGIPVKKENLKVIWVVELSKVVVVVVVFMVL